MKPKHVMKIFCILVILCCINTKTYAEVVTGGALTVDVTYGYDSNVKYNKLMPVFFEISNTGEDFEGMIQIKVPRIYEDSILFEKEIIIAGNSTKTIDMSIPMIASTKKLECNILNTKEKKVLSCKLKPNIETNDRSTLFLGVLSDDFNSISYLNKIPDIETLSGEHMRTKAFELKEKMITDNLYALDSIDILLINNYNTSNFSAKQYEVIKKWVEQGGSLILGTGNTYSKTLGIFQDNFLQGNVGSISNHTVEFSETLKIKCDVVDIDIPDALDIIESTDTEIMFPMSTDVIQKVHRGAGSIIVIGFDLGLEPFISYKYKEEAFSNILNNMVPFTNIIYDEDLDSRMVWRLSDIFNEAKNIPDIALVLIVLMVYILIMSPISYFILKKKDKRLLFWVTIPVCSLIFSIIIYIMGSDTRITKLQMHELNIHEMDQQSDTMMSYLAVVTPNNKKYSFTIGESNMVKPLSLSEASHWDEGKGNDYNEVIKYQGEKTIISLKNQSTFSNKYYKIYTKVKFSGTMKVKFKMNGNNVTGSIANQLNKDIQNGCITNGNLYIAIPDLKQNETIKIDNKNTKIFFSVYDYIEYLTNIEVKKYRSGELSNKEYKKFEQYIEILDATTSNNNLERFNLVGIEVNEKKREKEVDQYTVNVFKYTLESGDMDTISNILECDVIKREYPDEMVVSEEERILDLSKFKSIDILYYDNDNDEGYYRDIDSIQIYFWNVKSHKYELVFNKDKNLLNQDDMKKYLDKKMKLKIKIIDNEDNGSTEIPPISAIGRFK